MLIKLCNSRLLVLATMCLCPSTVRCIAKVIRTATGVQQAGRRAALLSLGLAAAWPALAAQAEVLGLAEPLPSSLPKGTRFPPSLSLRDVWLSEFTYATLLYKTAVLQVRCKLQASMSSRYHCVGVTMYSALSSFAPGRCFPRYSVSSVSLTAHGQAVRLAEQLLSSSHAPQQATQNLL